MRQIISWNPQFHSRWHFQTPPPSALPPFSKIPQKKIKKSAKIIAASKRMQTPSRVHRLGETISNLLLLRRHKALGFHITNSDRSPKG
jgi:hypothetical protein